MKDLIDGERTNVASIARKAGISYGRLWRSLTAPQLTSEEHARLAAAGFELVQEGAERQLRPLEESRR